MRNVSDLPGRESHPLCFRIRLTYPNLTVVYLNPRLPTYELCYPFTCNIFTLALSLSLTLSHPLSLSLTHTLLLSLSQRTHTSYMQSQTYSTYPNSSNTSAVPHSFTHSFTLFAGMQLVFLFLIQSTLTSGPHVYPYVYGRPPSSSPIRTYHSTCANLLTSKERQIG